MSDWNILFTRSSYSMMSQIARMEITEKRSIRADRINAINFLTFDEVEFAMVSLVYC